VRKQNPPPPRPVKGAPKKTEESIDSDYEEGLRVIIEVKEKFTKAYEALQAEQ